MTGSAVSSSSSASASPSSPRTITRRLPIGAEYRGHGQTHLRVWAPAAHRVEVVLESGGATALEAEEQGYFSGLVDAADGTRYQFRLDTADRLLPDPASRFQPEGPHGPSEIVDPRAFKWSDAAWKGARREGQVLYEMHVGTFTRDGTWAAAARELKELARIGVTMIEVMPVAEFDGRFGWGYDGVDMFAPFHLYGRPDDFRRFVDTAHALNVAVILDVVYNHLGPVGNYLKLFSPAYFSDTYENEWGDAINFDGADAGPVREFFETNARYWIDEYHLDGLRLDATQQIFDRSPENILAVIGRSTREAAGTRSVVLVAESEPQDTRLVRPIEEGGYGLDALWNDDFHHSAMVALTGHGEAYYSDTRGEPQEFISAAKYGYLFQGQHYFWQRQPRGTPAWGLPPSAFVSYLQNHDQVANSARGLRGRQLTSPGRWRAMTALLLLLPATPMLFQGQEFAASSPFLYFADFEPELAAAIRKGRGEFLTQFQSVADYEQRATLDDPGDPGTFERCKLDFRERETHAHAYALHADLLRLRREVVAFREPRHDGAAGPGIDGAVLSSSAFVLRFFTPGHGDDHLLIINLGADLLRGSFAEPLVAAPARTDWRLLWSSEHPAYGGGGTPDVFPDERWRLPGESAIVLSPGPRRPHRVWPKARRTA
jgi:maltooligosyltrehalose trehalohydrolase